MCTNRFDVWQRSASRCGRCTASQCQPRRRQANEGAETTQSQKRFSLNKFDCFRCVCVNNVFENSFCNIISKKFSIIGVYFHCHLAIVPMQLNLQNLD